MASNSVIIKKFVAKFVADGGDLLKGFKKLGDEVARLSKKVMGAFSPSNFKRVAKNIYDAIFQVFQKIGQVIASFQNDVMGIADASAKTGVSTEYISRLTAAVESFGGSTSDAIATVETMRSAITDLQFGQGALIEGAKKYGLQLHDASGQLLDVPSQLKAIEARMSKMTAGQAMDFGATLGLDDATVRLLRSGRMSELMGGAQFVVNKEDAATAQRLRESSAKIQQTFRAVGMEIKRVVIPLIEKIISAISVVVQSIGSAFRAVGLDKFINQKVKPIFEWMEKQANKVAKAFKKLNFRDLFKSSMEVRGTMGDTITQLTDTIKTMFKKAFTKLVEIAPDLAKAFMDLLKSLGAYLGENIPKIAGMLGSVMGTIFGSALAIGLDFAKLIGDAISNMSLGEIIKKVASVIWSVIKGAFNFLKDTIGAFLNNFLISAAEQVPGLGKLLKVLGIEKVEEVAPDFNSPYLQDMAANSGVQNKGQAQILNMPPRPSVTNNNGVANNNSNVSVTNNITVHGGDPRKVQNAVRSGTQDALKSSVGRSVAQTSSGVM